MLLLLSSSLLQILIGLEGKESNSTEDWLDITELEGKASEVWVEENEKESIVTACPITRKNKEYINKVMLDEEYKKRK
jgi:hypothetical protein